MLIPPIEPFPCPAPAIDVLGAEVVRLRVGLAGATDPPGHVVHHALVQLGLAGEEVADAAIVVASKTFGALTNLRELFIARLYCASAAKGFITRPGCCPYSCARTRRHSSVTTRT